VEEGLLWKLKISSWMRTVKVTRLCYNIRIISCLILTITMVISGITINKGSQAFAASGIKIAAVGNWGCTSNSQATVNNINSKNPELVLGLGDYSYESTPDCWFNEIKAFDSKMKISIGNHDVMTKKLLNSYLNHFSLSKQYYSFDFQDVHVLTMGTELEWEAGSEQYKFVKNDLEQVSKDPNIKWIIVTMHKPIYTSPNGCSASSCEGSKTLRDTYHPLFDNYGVDLVLEAHMHSYQRSYPIKYNVDNPSKPIITSSDKNNYNNPSGEIFAIVATGGINFHSLAGKAPFTATQQDSKFGILEMQFSNSKLDAKFISNAGSTMDHFTVAKTTKKPTSLTPTSTPTITKPPGTPKVVDKKSEDSHKLKNATKLNENQPANDKSTKKAKNTSNTNETKSIDSKDKIKTEKTKAQTKTKNQNPVLLSGTNLLQPPEENNKSSASDTEMSNPSKSNEIGINNNVPNSQTLDPFAPLSPFP
jgi:hypothetical protein